MKTTASGGSAGTPFMERMAEGIVKYRFLILCAFVVACIYAGLSVGKVKLNSDIAAYLPPETETYQGLIIMEEQFKTYASTGIMVANIPYDRAEDMAKKIQRIDHVTDVIFDSTPQHYNNSSALFTVSFDGEITEQGTVEAFRAIQELASGYELYTDTDIDYDYVADLVGQIIFVIAIMLVIIVCVLLFTSRSYFEVVVFLIVFLVAALLNLGTNYWLGTVCTLTEVIAIILQLALAIDYAIILSHRYQDELENYPTERQALVAALSKAIVEISSSSLTTISGMIALTLMQFRLGLDLGIVLTKGIVFSLITVFFLMPGLLLLFAKPLAKMRHRNLVPNISGWGRFLMKKKHRFVILFAVLLIPVMYLYQTASYSFSIGTVGDITYNQRRVAMHKIIDTFGFRSQIAILVPEGNFDNEQALLLDVEKLEGVESVTGLASYEVTQGHYLTDGYTPQMFADLANIDSEMANLLYMAYGVEHQQYQAIVGNTSEYRVPLVNILVYLFAKMDQGLISLDEPTATMINSLRGMLERSIEQVRGDTWDRLVITATVPAEGEEGYALVDEIHELAESYYGKGKILVLGDVTSARDLEESFSSDSAKIDFFTTLFVFIILLCTFRTVAGSAILVFIILSSIWFNFAMYHLGGLSTLFVTYTIVSAIQMGATIDYAIVLMSRYQDLKQQLPQQKAMVQALNESFPTVLTSGSILTLTGMLVALFVNDVYVAHIGLAIGRGSLISIALVMTVLPQLLVWADKLIEKTRFQIKIKWID